MAASRESTEAERRIEVLDQNFNDVLERLQPPAFGEETQSLTDRRTFLPSYHGRRFEDLSSPGLGTLVSVAYAIAHQQTAIQLRLALPNILFIDGLSEHLGEEGLDPERLQAAYRELIAVADEHRDVLQMIVIDNEVPEVARPYIRLELSEAERLVPAGVT